MTILERMRPEASEVESTSTDAIARALAALAPGDLLRLKRMAQLRARLVPGLDWEDLLNEALLRALDGSRPWPTTVPLLAFLSGIMRSLADARANERRRAAERRLADCGSDAEPLPDGRIQARQCLAAIARFFAADPDVLALIGALARQELGLPAWPANLTPQRREAARKRLARAILRGKLDAFLP
jgi:RNA polymerase sigma-70 factor (ECF subfamily)